MGLVDMGQLLTMLKPQPLKRRHNDLAVNSSCDSQTSSLLPSEMMHAIRTGHVD